MFLVTSRCVDKVLTMLMICLSVVKGYLRKGSCLTALKEYTLAAEAYQQAIGLDPGCEEAVEGFRMYVTMFL